MASAVSYVEVTKRFGAVTAVDGVSLDVQPGERLVLLGPSGCGKTTLLRLAAGLEKPSAGTILLDGRPARSAPADRDVAMVFQHGALYPHLSVFDNLAFNLRLRRESAAEVRRRVEQAAGWLALEGLLDRRPGELSGGQQQRVALGRALVRRPRVFLLDEPLSSLDPMLRHALRRQILELHERLGTTMVIVTHDQAEAMILGQRVALFREGRLQQLDRSEQIFRAPANCFVAEFMGDRPMNLLAGQIHDRAGDLVFAPEGGDWHWPLATATSQWLRTQTPAAVVLGLRSEHLRVSPCETAVRSRCQGCVTASETLIADSYVSLRAGKVELVARAASHDAFCPGQRVDVMADLEQAHFFDSRTRRRIGPEPDLTLAACQAPGGLTAT